MIEKQIWQKTTFEWYSSINLSLETQRNWVFATNPNFIIPISQQPDDAYISYFKLILFDPLEFIDWNTYGLRHLDRNWDLKIRVRGKDSIPLGPIGLVVLSFIKNKQQTSQIYLSVCLYPINVKTAELIGPEYFYCNSHDRPRECLWTVKFEKFGPETFDIYYNLKIKYL